jgi:predicted SnoaL-like aldol condensation-catalyzing enzyme
MAAPTLAPADVVKALWSRVFNAHDLTAIDDLVAMDYRQHTPGVPGGREGFRTGFSRYLAMSPDLSAEMKSIVEIEDIVVVRGLIRMSSPPPGHVSPVEVVDVFRVAEGQLQEHWEL